MLGSPVLEAWQGQTNKKNRQKIGQKILQKIGKIIKCDHTNSGRQFVVIEFTNLVEFMNVIE